MASRVLVKSIPLGHLVSHKQAVPPGADFGCAVPRITSPIAIHPAIAMIRIDRSAVPAPPYLDPKINGNVASKLQRARDHFREEAYETTSQSRFLFDAALWHARDVVTALNVLFQRKCAYCESVLEDGEGMTVDHFRPTSNTKDPISGNSYRDRYYWLAYEWTNLYATCRTCARNHANQFPIAGPVAEPEAFGEALLREIPILLDPCADEPNHHLYFTDKGEAVSRPYGGRNRGATTISIFGLNRAELVSARRHVGETTEKIVRDLNRTPSKVLLTALMEYLPYQAVRRQVVEERARALKWPRSEFVGALQEARLAADWVAPVWPEEVRPPRPQKHVPTPKPPAQVNDLLHIQAGATLTAQTLTSAAPPSTTHAAYVEKIEIRNFRAIRDLTLVIAKEAPKELDEASATKGTDRPPKQPWLVLLGENGTGKSSVLQALAYALMGEAASAELLRPEKILRRAPPGEPQPKKGFVRVTLSTETIEFTFTAKKATWISGSAGANVFLRAYGSTRLLPSPRHPREDPSALVRVDNLFDPFEPLNDADHWLSGLTTRAAEATSPPATGSEAHRALQKFNAAAIAFKDLLRLENEKRLRHDPALGMVLDDQEKIPTRLSELSDGYQTVIALAADVMAGVPEGETDFATRAGIVLLDELGTHLHPRWRMEIVKGLRRAFPSLQFIATTHEPLCLRGLGKGEVVVMTREDGRMRAITDLPSPEGLRVDQLLTSRYFGLHTTIDPTLDREFQEYYDLLARAEALNDGEKARRDELKARLQPYRVLGYTRRDQLVAEVLDEYFSRERTAADPAKLRDDTKQKVRDIWERVTVPLEVAR